MIIAIDGPTASGKGTIAKKVAAHFNLPLLDTGLLYRAVGKTLHDNCGDADNAGDALAACGFDDALLGDDRLRDEDIGSLASRVSVHDAVRKALFERQQNFAYQDGGAVLDGRDIGTVIAPDADVKLFVTASPQVRAMRRHKEMIARGRNVSEQQMLDDITARDERDSGRRAAPLKPAQDAHLLDTTNLAIGDAVQQAIALIQKKLQNQT